MADSQDLKDKIRSKWRDPSFPGSFAGLENFHSALVLDGINIKKQDLHKIMSQDPQFIIEQRRVRKIHRRDLDNRGYFTLVQGDLAVMPPSQGYKYILVVVDTYSIRSFARPLKQKTSKEVRQGLKSIFEEAGRAPEVFSTDAGTEFTSLHQFYLEHKIFHTIKYGDNKAFLVGKQGFG